MFYLESDPLEIVLSPELARECYESTLAGKPFDITLCFAGGPIGVHVTSAEEDRLTPDDLPSYVLEGSFQEEPDVLAKILTDPESDYATLTECTPLAVMLTRVMEKCDCLPPLEDVSSSNHVEERHVVRELPVAVALMVAKELSGGDQDEELTIDLEITWVDRAA